MEDDLREILAATLVTELQWHLVQGVENLKEVIPLELKALWISATAYANKVSHQFAKVCMYEPQEGPAYLALLRVNMVTLLSSFQISRKFVWWPNLPTKSLQRK